jgi:hypothetical protein
LLFRRRPRAGVREITSLPVDVRITRLWDRFSVDVGFALERNTTFFGWRIHERAGTPYRIFIFEDCDRYAIRAMCIFAVKEEGGKSIGYVMELLHDRSVTGMRAASHLLGLALREMSDAGAESARALALPHSGDSRAKRPAATTPGVPSATRAGRSPARLASSRAPGPRAGPAPEWTRWNG